MTPDDPSPGRERRAVRWFEFVPELLLAAGLVVFLADEPDAATSAFKSGRAIAIMAGAAVVWTLGRLLATRVVPWLGARLILFGSAAVAALAVIVLPAYDNDKVVEAFPLPPVIASTTPPTTPVAVDMTVPMTRLMSPTSPAVATRTLPPTAATPPTTTPTEPVRLRTARFMGIDHRASGTVSVYQAPDGRHVIGLEAFDIQPGPDYDVYVVPGTDRKDTDGGVRLDDLRGNQGTQYYEVPADVDIRSGVWTVLVWCQTFGVPVANATPA